MKKFMKKYTASSAKSIGLVVIGFACAVGTIALAYTAPTAAPTGGNVPAPVNTGTVAQTKSGDLQVGLPNASASLISRNWLMGVFGLFNNMVSSRRGAFVDEPGNAIVINGQNGTDFFQAGILKTGLAEIAQGLTVNQYGNTLIKSLTPTTNTQAPVLDVQATSANGGGKIFSATGQQGGMTLWAKTGNGAFGFTDTSKALLSVGGNLNVANQVQIAGGSPAQGKILVASDNLGTAEWGGETISTAGDGGLIKYVRAPISSGSVASAFCGVDAADDANWIAIGGGGYCQWGTQISQPVINRSSSAHQDGHRTEPAIGWHIDCLDRMMTGGGGDVVGHGGNPGFAKAEVICMKRASFVTGTAPVTSSGSSGSSGGGSTSTLAWHPAPAGLYGVTGGTCNAYMAQAAISLGKTVSRIKGKSSLIGGYVIPSCAVEYTAPVTYSFGGLNTTQYTGTCLSSLQQVVSNPSSATFRVVPSCSSSTTGGGSTQIVTSDTQLEYIQ